MKRRTTPKYISIVATSIVAMFATSLFFLYDSNFQVSETDNLLRENIEALAQYENSPQTDGRCPGPNIYSETGISKGTMEERMHKNDSTDVVFYFVYERCYANGYGEKAGTNEYISKTPTGFTYSKCNGRH